MNDAVWWGLAIGRLAVRVEMLEQENAMLKQELEKTKGLRAVEMPAEVKADAT